MLLHFYSLLGLIGVLALTPASAAASRPHPVAASPPEAPHKTVGTPAKPSPETTAAGTRSSSGQLRHLTAVELPPAAVLASEVAASPAGSPPIRLRRQLRAHQQQLKSKARQTARARRARLHH